MLQYIQWTSYLFFSSVFIYRTLRIFNIKMKYPIDTVSKLNAGTYQIFIVLWSIYNIYQEMNNKITDRSIDTSLIGYFVYDTCMLLLTPYGRTQYIYFLHHILSIYIINICITYNIAPPIYTNTIYFLMETGSCTLNWMKLCNKYNPGYANKCRNITHVIYFTTRCIALPVFIYDYTNNIYQPVWHQQITVFMLVLLYIMSVDWFLKMTKNFIKN